MSRRIVTQQRQAAGAGGEIDGYFDRVVKYIPGDVVAAWVTVKGLVEAATDVPQRTVLWVSFAVGVLFTALWTHMHSDPKKGSTITQVAVSTVAFVIWVVALGMPFDWNPLYGSLSLIGFTLVAGLVIPKS